MLVLQAQGKLAEAEEPLKRSLATFEKSLGADHPNVATGLSNLALLLWQMERFDEAVGPLERAMEIKKNRGENVDVISSDLADLRAHKPF